MFRLFEERNFCKKYRIFENITFLTFVDLGKIYQSYYLLVTTMLGKIHEMSLQDCKRCYLAYTNFVRINKEVRAMAACVLSLFEGQKQSEMQIDFFDVDASIFDHLMVFINLKSEG